MNINIEKQLHNLIHTSFNQQRLSNVEKIIDVSEYIVYPSFKLIVDTVLNINFKKNKYHKEFISHGLDENNYNFYKWLENYKYKEIMDLWDDFFLYPKQNILFEIKNNKYLSDKVLNNINKLYKLNIGVIDKTDAFEIMLFFFSEYNSDYNLLPFFRDILEIDFGYVEINGRQYPKNIKELRLFDCNLTKIPKNIIYFTELERLDLSNNFISKIEYVNNLKNLVSLNLSYNEISEIKNLDGLTNLEYLNLSYNCIKHIQNLNPLKNLNYLDLNHNRIDTLEGLKVFRKFGYFDISFKRGL